MRIDPSGLLALFFPGRCVGCGMRGVDICPKCLRSLRPLGPASCPRCGRPTSLGAPCTSCRSYDGPLTGIRSPLVYEGVTRRAIHAFKYRNRRSLARVLAEMIEMDLRRRPLQIDLLTPVPLHPRRLSHRGYNQSALLAEELGRFLGLPTLQVLERTRETGEQAGLGAAARRANVRGAFRCTAESERIKGARVGLLDDVCTTGATLEDCARALRDGGASMVWGLVIARDL